MSDYLAIASLLSGFAAAILVFRIHREAGEGAKTPGGLAWADFLLLGAAMLALWLAVLPILLFGAAAAKLAGAACTAAVVLFGGYLPAMLDHHRMVLGEGRTGRRERGEPVERVIVLAVSAFAAVVFAAGMTRGSVW